MGLLAEKLGYQVDKIRLLEDVTMRIEAGRVTTVLGPNGAGKTSLLRLLCGELSPSSGNVSLNGRPLRDWATRERAQQLAVLPQHSVLNFPFTAAEVVALGRIPHATGSVRDSEIVAQALKVVDVEYLARREFTRLSGGEKQRVQLARVLAQVWEPVPAGDRFLLLDEPTSSLDLAHQQMTLDVVRQLRDDGVGIVMVLHDLNLAARCADQMVVLCCGQLACVGEPADVLTPALIRQVFQVDASISLRPESGTPMVVT